jgi:presenilin-like A22 family membrane protease
MSVLTEMGQKVGIAGELLGFFWHRKMWWIIPMVFVMLFFGIIIVFGSSTGVGPFIYTLF